MADAKTLKIALLTILSLQGAACTTSKPAPVVVIPAVEQVVECGYELADRLVEFPDRSETYLVEVCEIYRQDNVTGTREFENLTMSWEFFVHDGPLTAQEKSDRKEAANRYIDTLAQ